MACLVHGVAKSRDTTERLSLSYIYILHIYIYLHIYVNKYTHICIHLHIYVYKIMNKELLYSLGNYTQYFVIIYKRK